MLGVYKNPIFFLKYFEKMRQNTITNFLYVKNKYLIFPKKLFHLGKCCHFFAIACQKWHKMGFHPFSSFNIFQPINHIRTVFFIQSTHRKVCIYYEVSSSK